MKRKSFISKNNTKKQKITYYFLIGLALFSILFGILFIFMINNESVLLIKNNILNYYENISSSFSSFFKSLFNSYLYLIIIWILGISIIGVPIVILMFLFKSFLFGFSISSIFSSLGFKGITIALIDIFPNKITYIILLLLITFYSISFSFKLFKFFFFKKNINFKEAFNKYFRILLFSLIVSLFIAIYEGFIINYLVNFFY